MPWKAGRGLRYGAGAVLAPVVLVLAYLAATLVGAAIPATGQAAAETGKGTRIYLLTSLLHADFAIPVDNAMRERFAFLREGGVPVDHPELRYLVFGWGARDFYLRTKTLADIRPLPALKGIFGDRSVMHVLAARDVRKDEDAIALDLPPGGLERLLAFIEAGFARHGAAVLPIEGAGYGMSDVFFEGQGAFNIFRPCNIWVAEGLRQAGISTGAWTPTTFALELGLSMHSNGALAQTRQAGFQP
jgi:uncharacterized protein (TIGR02117 family)